MHFGNNNGARKLRSMHAEFSEVSRCNEGILVPVLPLFLVTTIAILFSYYIFKIETYKLWISTDKIYEFKTCTLGI